MKIGDLPHAGLTRQILAGFFHVLNALGPGLPEAIYRRALVKWLRKHGLSCTTEVRIPVSYDGSVVGSFRLDIVVEGLVVIELKAKSRIEPIDEAQLLNYLRSTAYEVGLLLNFANEPTIRRFHYSNEKKAAWLARRMASVEDHSLDMAVPFSPPTP